MAFLFEVGDFVRNADDLRFEYRIAALSDCGLRANLMLASGEYGIKETRKLLLVRPANWRLNDRVLYKNYEGVIVGFEDDPDEPSALVNWTHKNGEKYRSVGDLARDPAESKAQLIARPGVPLYKASSTCSDCKGRGVILLFSSVVTCECKR